MAEFIFRDMTKEYEGVFETASAATSSEELGCPMYPPAAAELSRHGIPFEERFARKTTLNDYDRYDYIIGMDSRNRYNMERIFGYDREGKISLLLDYTDTPRDVADPWYSGDFEKTYDDIVRGCKGFLEKLKKEGKI